MMILLIFKHNARYHLFKIVPFTILIIYFLGLDANSNKEAQNDIEDIERNIID